MTLSVLLVEDDRDLSHELAVYLTGSGFAVRCAGSVAEAEAELAEPVAVIVLDINLPDGDGLELCRRLRPYVRSGIIICTGRPEQALRITSLRDGADAYLVKPVDPEELEVTILSLDRRLNFPPSSLAMRLFTRPWHFDRIRRLLLAPNGASIVLNDPEATLLNLLFMHPEHKASRQEIIIALELDETVLGEHRLEALVSRLRKKIFAKCGVKLPLFSDYGVGYSFNERVKIL